MSIISTRLAARRVTAAAFRRTPQRGIINWMTNYPDKVAHYKKIQVKGGIQQGELNPTWLKQPGDHAVAYFGLGLFVVGITLWVQGFYRLAFGVGKIE